MADKEWTYYQLRAESEKARMGQSDQCEFCHTRGIIGTDLHIFLRALVTASREWISYPAVCAKCENKYIDSFTQIG